MKLTVDDLIRVAQAIIDSVSDDNARHGGLLSRSTIRACDEARLVISRFQSVTPADLSGVWDGVEGVEYGRGTEERTQGDN